MTLIHKIADLKDWFESADRKNKTLGFVPTMGYLHQGHCSLVQAARSQNDLVVASVFVNPTQFGPNEDFESYPRDIQRDYQMAVAAGADVVFNPPVEEIYPPGASTAVEVCGTMAEKLCGISRPSHFKGVTTVVSALFNILRPDHAYFGQKDAQQVLIIDKMVRDLHMPVKVVMCPTIREEDGLAMSSRNAYLKPEERKQAVCIHQSLNKAEEYLHSDAKDRQSVARLLEIMEKHIRKSDLGVIDYIQILDGETLGNMETIEPGKKALAAVAVKFGKSRLIDNRMLIIDKGDKNASEYV